MGSGQAISLHASAALNEHNVAYRENDRSIVEAGPTLLGATSSTLEVGMPTGTHGWLKIRAEIADGVVTASLSTRSAGAQEMLHHELPSLTAFLQEERIGGGTVVVKQTLSAYAGDMSRDSEMQRQRQPTQEGSRGNDVPARRDKNVLGFDGQLPIPETWRGFSDGAMFLPASAGGSWLNVRV